LIVQSFPTTDPSEQKTQLSARATNTTWLCQRCSDKFILLSNSTGMEPAYRRGCQCYIGQSFKKILNKTWV